MCYQPPLNLINHRLLIHKPDKNIDNNIKLGLKDLQQKILKMIGPEISIIEFTPKNKLLLKLHVA